MVTFSEIKDAYSKRRRKLLMDGRFQRPTEGGYWATSNPDQIYDLFRRIHLERFSSFVDLGSGDGIVTAIASLFTKAGGIEIDRALHEDACGMMKRLGISADMVNTDFIEHDLSGYDVIFINPDNYFYKLEKRITENFSGKIVIVDNIFRPLNLECIRRLKVKGMNFSIYRSGREGR